MSIKISIKNNNKLLFQKYGNLIPDNITGKMIKSPNCFAFSDRDETFAFYEG